MMGAMVVGGMMLGRGMMHGGRNAGHDARQWGTADIEAFQPERLLEQRTMLELTDDQVSSLEALRDDVAADSRTREDASRTAFGLLRPLQRAAVRGRSLDSIGRP